MGTQIEQQEPNPTPVLRVRDGASTLGCLIVLPGQKSCVLGGLSGPRLPQSTLEKVGGRSPRPFPVFAVGKVPGTQVCPGLVVFPGSGCTRRGYARDPRIPGTRSTRDPGIPGSLLRQGTPCTSHPEPRPPALGGPQAGTQPFEKFVSEPDCGGPSGLFPTGNPSIELGGFAPHLN